MYDMDFPLYQTKGGIYKFILTIYYKNIVLALIASKLLSQIISQLLSQITLIETAMGEE